MYHSHVFMGWKQIIYVWCFSFQEENQQLPATVALWLLTAFLMLVTALLDVTAFPSKWAENRIIISYVVLQTSIKCRNSYGKEVWPKNQIYNIAALTKTTRTAQLETCIYTSTRFKRDQIKHPVPHAHLRVLMSRSLILNALYRSVHQQRAEGLQPWGEELRARLQSHSPRHQPARPFRCAFSPAAAVPEHICKTHGNATSARTRRGCRHAPRLISPRLSFPAPPLRPAAEGRWGHTRAVRGKASGRTLSPGCLRARFRSLRAALATAPSLTAACCRRYLTHPSPIPLPIAATQRLRRGREVRGGEGGAEAPPSPAGGSSPAARRAAPVAARQHGGRGDPRLRDGGL